jgi:hypothetical protein
MRASEGFAEQVPSKIRAAQTPDECCEPGHPGCEEPCQGNPSISDLLLLSEPVL